MPVPASPSAPAPPPTVTTTMAVVWGQKHPCARHWGCGEGALALSLVQRLACLACCAGRGGGWHCSHACRHAHVQTHACLQ